MGFWDGKCVAVTGASGFIGSAVVARLGRESGARVIRLARSLERTSDCLPVALESLDANVWLHAGIERIDVLLHLGGFIPKSPADTPAIEANFESNLLGTRRLLESLPSVPSKIVFASTVDVYAPNDGVITENSPLGPSSLYGASKLFLEKLIALYCLENTSDLTVLRVGHTYGPGEGAFKKLIPNLIVSLLDGREPVVDGDGSVLRDYSFVADVGDAFVRAAQTRSDGLGPINVVSGTSVSMLALAKILVELTSFRGEVRCRSELRNGASLRFNNSRFRQVLGPLSPHALREGLAMEIEYFRNRRDA